MKNLASKLKIRNCFPIGIIFILLFSQSGRVEASEENLDSFYFQIQIQKELKQSLDEFRFSEAQSSPKQTEDFEGKRSSSWKGAFYQHIQEALAVNLERREQYSRLTRGKSDSISRFLIWLERFSLLPAKVIDRWGKTFQDRGIAIISNDFASMQGIKSVETPPIYRKSLGKIQASEMKKILKGFQRKFFFSILSRKFQEAGELAYQTLQYVRKSQKENQSSMVLTIHFIESLGLGALHGIKYSMESHGATDTLSKAFLLVQLVPFCYCLPIDLKIQRIHEMGVGIVENDIPGIPFEKEWEQRK